MAADDGLRRLAYCGALGRPGPWHELVEARGRPEVDELGEHVGEVGLRIDAAELASLDQRSDAGPERTKNGAPHVVPLSAPARDLLRVLLPEHEGDARRTIEDGRAKGTLALPGLLGTPFAGWSKAKAALDAALVDARAKAAADVGTSPAPLVPWSVHDLRRTVATGLQRLGVRLEVTEAVLNHISGSRGGIAGVLGFLQGSARTANVS